MTYEWFENRTTNVEIVARIDERKITMIVREWVTHANVLKDIITLYVDDDIFIQKAGYYSASPPTKQVIVKTNNVSELCNPDLHFQRSTIEDIRYATEEYENVVQVLTSVYNTVLEISKES